MANYVCRRPIVLVTNCVKGKPTTKWQIALRRIRPIRGQSPRSLNMDVGIADLVRNIRC